MNYFKIRSLNLKPFSKIYDESILDLKMMTPVFRFPVPYSQLNLSTMQKSKLKRKDIHLTSIISNLISI